MITHNLVATSSIWREEIQNRNGPPRFGGKKFKIEMDPLDLAGRNSEMEPESDPARRPRRPRPSSLITVTGRHSSLLVNVMFATLPLLIPDHTDA